jgi:choline dehydrogenase-like flavoprotein
MTSTLPISDASNPLGVLDESLRVRGVSNLRVADASVFPTGLSCHTQAAVVAVVSPLSSFCPRSSPLTHNHSLCRLRSARSC